MELMQTSLNIKVRWTVRCTVRLPASFYASLEKRHGSMVHLTAWMLSLKQHLKMEQFINWENVSVLKSSLIRIEIVLPNCWFIAIPLSSLFLNLFRVSFPDHTCYLYPCLNSSILRLIDSLDYKQKNLITLFNIRNSCLDLFNNNQKLKWTFIK